MFETNAALLLAHALADFTLQSDRMVAEKRRFWALSTHIAIVGLTAWAALGFAAPGLALTVTAAHLATDLVKTFALRPGLRAYLLDQAVHILTILIAVPLFAEGWADGLWAAHLPAAVPVWLALAAGAIFAIQAGGHAVAMLTEPILRGDWALRKETQTGGIAGAGATIGQIERGIAYALVLSDYPTGVAILVAAKSILRFSDTQRSRKTAEYVIIGTLASIGWALLTGLATAALLDAMAG